MKSHNLKAVLVFIDFKHKAFDSVHRGRMLQIVRAYDTPEKLIDAIGFHYQGKKAGVITPDGITDFFLTTDWGFARRYLGTLHLLDYAMRRVIDGREEELGFKIDQRRSRRRHSVAIIDTDFADDIAITTTQIHQAQEMLASVELEAVKIGLHLNSKKTEVMHFNQGGL